jgi:hypothetical protein
MAMLAEELHAHPLSDGQRILALTFMHGARRRLADRLHAVQGLTGRTECVVIDSLAWRLVRRWRGLVAELGLPELQEAHFDAVCDAAGAVLEQPQVLSWAVSSFPIILVDEGQDLRPQRLRMLKALSQGARVLVAADEYQCLDQTLRPNPLVTWIQEQVHSEILTQVHRTNVVGLRNAATSVRNGGPPVQQGQFRMAAANSHFVAAAYLAKCRCFGTPTMK